MNVDYVKLVNEEFKKYDVKDGRTVNFCKVKQPVKTMEELLENFIPEIDLPKLDPSYKYIPISITDFPRVLQSMTSNQAGYWAIKKCKQQNWHISEYDCCLNNLEMDL